MKGIVILLLIAGAVVLRYCESVNNNQAVSLKQWDQKLKSSPESTLAEIAVEMSKPSKTLNSPELAFEGATAGPGKLLTLNFTFKTLEASQVSSAQAGMFASNVAPVLCQEKELQLLHRHDVMVRLAARGKDKVLITMPRISKKSCEQVEQVSPST